jgi:hypothetical protein
MSRRKISIPKSIWNFSSLYFTSEPINAHGLSERIKCARRRRDASAILFADLPGVCGTGFGREHRQPAQFYCLKRLDSLFSFWSRRGRKRLFKLGLIRRRATTFGFPFHHQSAQERERADKQPLYLV